MSSSTATACSSDPPPDPSQPFPSPGSAFIPPPVPGPHEFAVRRSSLPRKMSTKDSDDAVADLRRSCNGTTTPTPNGVAQSTTTPTSLNGVVSLIDTRAPAPLSFLRSLVPDFIISILNIPRSIWHILPFQDPTSPAFPPACDSPNPHPDPQFFLPSPNQSHHRLSTQSVTSLTSTRPAPPSPAMSRRASGLSRPVSGMSTAVSSRPASGVQHARPVSGSESRRTSGTVQPMTATTPITPIVTPPSLSRSPHDRRLNLTPTIPASNLDLDPIPAEPTPTATQTKATALSTTTPALIWIRDYGFAPTDPRFSGQGPHVPRANRPAFLARRLASCSVSTPSSLSEGDDDDYEDEDEDEKGEREKMNVDLVQNMCEDVVDDGTNGWGAFRWSGFGHVWGFGRMSGIASSTGATSSSAGFPTRGDLDRNFGGEDEYEYEDDMEIDEEGDVDTEGELPLFPGLYRALYAFEPEGTAEMKLDEDQLVRVIGRGGGVGWAVVVKDGLKDTGLHALVPESYLEPVRLDGEDEDA